jgi:transposase
MATSRRRCTGTACGWRTATTGSLTKWRREFLAYFATAGASNSGTEAVNGLIELHRRVARGFRNRDNYRLRMLLIGGGLTGPHLK